jgi:predicted dehydrogenase
MAATGNLHGQRIRVFGEKASLEWIQEQPEQLHLRPLDGPHRVLSRGCGYLSAAAQRATRLWPGHPEGFLEAFANLYAGAADAVLARRDDAPLDRSALSFPTVEDGVLGVKFVEAAVESSRRDGAWVDATVDLGR